MPGYATRVGRRCSCARRGSATAADAAIPETLPLVLRASRGGTIAAFAAGVGFGLLGLLFALAGSWVGGAFCLVLGAIGLVAGIAAVLPGRTQLRLDDQGFAVASIVKRWKVGWGEVERFQADTVQVGRSPSPVVRVVYREGFAPRHTPRTRLGQALGVDERYVWPGYGGLDSDALAALLEAFRARFGA